MKYTHFYILISIMFIAFVSYVSLIVNMYIVTNAPILSIATVMVSLPAIGILALIVIMLIHMDRIVDD